jgi:hypothetical protein
MVSIRGRVVLAAAAREADLLWRAFEPAYECGLDAVTHNEWSPPEFGEHA